jgi:hypothetical protein
MRKKGRKGRDRNKRRMRIGITVKMYKNASKHTKNPNISSFDGLEERGREEKERNMKEPSQAAREFVKIRIPLSAYGTNLHEYLKDKPNMRTHTTERERPWANTEGPINSSSKNDHIDHKNPFFGRSEEVRNAKQSSAPIYPTCWV